MSFNQYKQELLQNAASRRIQLIIEKIYNHISFSGVKKWEVEKSMGFGYPKNHWQAIDFVRWLSKTQREVKYINKIMEENVFDESNKRALSKLKQVTKKVLQERKHLFENRMLELAKERHFDEIDKMFIKVLFQDLIISNTNE